MYESCHTYVWVMLHVWRCHVPHSCGIGIYSAFSVYKYVTSHIRMSHVTYMYESCHASEGVTSPTAVAYIARPVIMGKAVDEDTLRVCCNVLQCVAVCCSELQCVAMCCSAVQWLWARLLTKTLWGYVAKCCSLLQCVAVCCCVLQCVAVFCSVLQSIAVRCSVVAVRCSVLQHSAVQCSAVHRCAL